WLRPARPDALRFWTGSSPRRGGFGRSHAMDARAPYAVAMADHLVPPYGGVLVDGVVDDERAFELRKASTHWPSCDLPPRHLCDLELLLSGAFSPLRGFLGSADVASVCADMRLSDGTLWPIPVTLDVPDDLATQVGPGASVALRDPEGVMLAALHVGEVYRPDRRARGPARRPLHPHTPPRPP